MKKRRRRSTRQRTPSGYDPRGSFPTQWAVIGWRGKEPFYREMFDDGIAAGERAEHLKYTSLPIDTITVTFGNRLSESYSYDYVSGGWRSQMGKLPGWLASALKREKYSNNWT